MRDEHLSEELLLRLVDGELGSGEAVESHLAGCDECQRRWERLVRVSAVLENRAAAFEDRRPSAGRREALLRAMRRTEVRRRLRPAPRRRVLAFAAGVFLLIGVAALVRNAPMAVPKDTISESDFIALPYSDENLAPEGAVVLEVEVPRSALLLAGRLSAGDDASGRVKAEVVVGADGLARAIRFLN